MDCKKSPPEPPTVNGKRMLQLRKHFHIYELAVPQPVAQQELACTHLRIVCELHIQVDDVLSVHKTTIERDVLDVHRVLFSNDTREPNDELVHTSFCDETSTTTDASAKSSTR